MLVTHPQVLVTVSHISRDGNSADHPCPVDVHEIRLRNLRGLLKEIADDNQSAFADRLDRPPNLINRYLHRKKIGAPFARYVETRLRKPGGWMDQDHSVSAAPASSPTRVPNPHGWATPYGLPVSEIGVRLARKWQELQEPARDQVFRMIETMLALQKERRAPSASEKAKEQKAYNAFVDEVE